MNRKTLSEGLKKKIAGKQFFKCANKPNSKLNRLENYKCPLWERSEHQGAFDNSGYEIDHIEEFSLTHNNNIDNLQALCKMCHSVKTKNFLIKNFNFGKLFLKNNNHSLYLCDSDNIINNYELWEYNRPPDDDRVNEIKKYYSEKESMDGIIYIALINKKLYCYDGGHRLKAVEELKQNKKIIIDVVENPTDEYLKEKFKILNKCIPVMNLYINDDKNNKLIKKKIEELAKDLKEKWKKHYTTSPNPKRPNFNLDTLKERIKYILNKNNVDSKVSYEKMLEIINNYNDKIKNSIEEVNNIFDISEKLLSKCKKNNCYIFLERY